jgi:carboxypeptidase C (cathepsin A)
MFCFSPVVTVLTTMIFMLTADDATAALDNYNMIQAFLTRFPQYRTNDLYITSESYGGHYMPTLAKQIVDENAQAATTGNAVINFKGFAVGNPATTTYSTIPAGMETYWGHQLISKPLYDDFTKYCKGPIHTRNVSSKPALFRKVLI